MLKALTKIAIECETLQIIMVEPTAPDSKIYYAVDENGLGIWISENEITKIL